MMSKEKRRVPKLRFPGFTEDWEQRKLGDFTNQINTFVNPEDAKLPLWSLTAEAGLIEKSDRYERDFLVKKKDQFKRIETNTLVYNPMNITIGSIDIYTGLYPIAVSGYYVSIVYDKNIDTDFLKEALLLPSSLKMYKNYATGSLIERQRVQYPTFSKLQLLFPNLDEQKVIGQLFKSLNLNITLHQRKLDNLKLKKKALLQKLFPKNGERYPELRFPGFTDAWEQRKLSDILVERNEQQVETSEYPLMSFVQGIGVTPKGERYDRSFLVLDQSKKYKRTELGDFIYSSNNLETGSIGINKTGKAVISPVYSIFYGVSIGDSEFIGIMSLLPGFIAKMIRFRQGVVYGQWRIHEKDFLDISVAIPSVAERTKITKLILSIEELITLHQRKLDHLKLQKKALLQQMFV